VDRRTLAQRTKAYFGESLGGPPRKSSWTRVAVSFLIVVGVCVGLVVLGVPNAAFIIVIGAVLGTGTAVHRRLRRPEPPAEAQGWRMDHDGEWRWWDGSAWTESPPGETPRKIGPEIEW
jgi:hypothetical protein